MEQNRGPQHGPGQGGHPPLTLARLHMRAGDQAVLESNLAVQTTENVYRVIIWLASTLQAWGIALVLVHNAVPEPDNGP